MKYTQMDTQTEMTGRQADTHIGTQTVIWTDKHNSQSVRQEDTQTINASSYTHTPHPAP